MKTTENKIEEIKQNGYSLNLDSLISKTFEIFKKIALLAGLGFLLISLALAGIIMGIIQMTIGIESLSQSLVGFKSITNLSSNALIFYLVFMIIISALAAPFSAGVFKVAHHAATGQNFTFPMLFEHYKSKYLKQILLATVLITSFNLCLSSILEIANIQIIGTLISYFIQLGTLLMIPLIIFGNLTAVQAIQSSFTVVMKQFWIILLLMMLSGLLAMVGLIAFCIGIFFTMPIVYSAQYVIYNEAIGFYEKDSIDEIGTTLEDLE